MVKFSYCHVPAYPLEESIEIIKTADESGPDARPLGRCGPHPDG